MAGEQFRRVAVVGELFGLGVPMQLLAGLEGDVAQMRHRGRAVADLHVGVGRLARAHAFDEVGRVLPCSVGGVQLFALERLIGRSRALRLRISLVADTIRLERAIAAVAR